MAATAGLLYIASAGISYLMFLGLIPPLRLVPLYVMFLVLVLLGHLFQFLLAGKFRLNVVVCAGLVLLSMTILQLAWLPVIYEAGGAAEYTRTMANACIASWLLFLSGCGLGSLLNEKREKKALFAGLGIQMVLIAIVLYANFAGQDPLGDLQFKFNDYEARARFNYLALGDGLAVIGIITTGYFIRRFWVAVTLFAITGFALTLSYSRTSLYVFLFSGFLMLATNLSSVRRRLGLFVCCLGCLLLVSSALQSNVGFHSALGRMSALVSNPTEDASFLSRLELVLDGVERLKHVGILGRFMDEWLEQGEEGVYVHGILSYWICYGFLPFVGLCGVIISTGLKVLSRKEFAEPRNAIALGLLSFVVIAVVVSRAYPWAYLWYGLGYCGTIACWRR